MIIIDLLKGYFDSEWRTKSELIAYLEGKCGLKFNERLLRRSFEKFNKLYETGETEMFVAHSNKGYMLTSDPMIIRNSLWDDYKRGIKLITRNHRCLKMLSEKNQLSLEEKDVDLYETVKKLGV